MFSKALTQMKAFEANCRTPRVLYVGRNLCGSISVAGTIASSNGGDKDEAASSNRYEEKLELLKKVGSSTQEGLP